MSTGEYLPKARELEGFEQVDEAEITARIHEAQANGSARSEIFTRKEKECKIGTTAPGVSIVFREGGDGTTMLFDNKNEKVTAIQLLCRTEEGDGTPSQVGWSGNLLEAASSPLLANGRRAPDRSGQLMDPTRPERIDHPLIVLKVTQADGVIYKSVVESSCWYGAQAGDGPAIDTWTINAKVSDMSLKMVPITMD